MQYHKIVIMQLLLMQQISATMQLTILVQSLQSVGFVNYFTEWCHWSYGDKYWAVVTGSNQAIYNPVSEQELSDLLKK